MHPRFQEISTFIRDAETELRQAIDSVPADQRNRAPRDGGWSVDGVVGHVSVVEGRVAGLIRKKLDEARATGLGEEADSSPILPTLNLERFLDRTNKLKAPDILQPTAITSEAAWATLQESRRQIDALIAEADGRAVGEITHPHLIFGPLDLYTWFAFLGAHKRRHAAQIREIGASFANEA